MARLLGRRGDARRHPGEQHRIEVRAEVLRQLGRFQRVGPGPALHALMSCEEAKPQPPVRFRDLAEDQDVAVLVLEAGAPLPFGCQLPLGPATKVREPRARADPDDLEPSMPGQRCLDMAGLAEPLVVAFQIGDQDREMGAGRRRHLAALQPTRDPPRRGQDLASAVSAKIPSASAPSPRTRLASPSQHLPRRPLPPTGQSLRLGMRPHSAPAALRASTKSRRRLCPEHASRDRGSCDRSGSDGCTLLCPASD